MDALSGYTRVYVRHTDLNIEVEQLRKGQAKHEAEKQFLRGEYTKLVQSRSRWLSYS